MNIIDRSLSSSCPSLLKTWLPREGCSHWHRLRVWVWWHHLHHQWSQVAWRCLCCSLSSVLTLPSQRKRCPLRCFLRLKSRSKGYRHSLCTTVSLSRIRPSDLPPYQACYQWPRKGRSEDRLAQHSVRSPPSNEIVNRSSSDLWCRKREHSCRLHGRMHIQGTRTSPVLPCPRSED